MARMSRRSKAVGEGSVGSRGFKVASVRKAEVKEVSISVGKRGPGPPRKPIAFCARQLSREGIPPCAGTRLFTISREELEARAG